MFSYDSYNRLERPYVYLAKANKDYIGTIQAKDLPSDLCFNNISTISFTVNKYEDGEPTLHYDEIEALQLIELSYIGWFQITHTKKDGDGNNEYISVDCSSLENEACTKLLTSFGQLGVSSDSQGGLDRYRLCNPSDVSHSIMHIWQQKLPSWTIGYIDPTITTEYRTFTNDEVGAYSFLVNDCATTYECIFQFDTFNQVVSAYKLENIGVNTSIYLSYDNLINNTSLEVNSSDIITVYTVSGGDDNGSTLGIIEVNPAGTNQICNFSYYKSKMSTALRSKYEAYEVEYNSRLTSFTPAIEYVKVLYEELNGLNNRLPSVSTSTNWYEYGLVELKVKYEIYNSNMSLYIGKTDATSLANYNSNYSLRESVNTELKVRQSQVNSKETQIINQQILCGSLTLNLEEYLGATLYKELNRFYHEATFTDDTFIVTSSMTEAEALQMKRDLLVLAQTDLSKKCKPSYTLEVNTINFTTIFDYKKYSDQLALGNIITIDFGNDILIEARLLKLHVNWDDPSDFSMTFSSKNRLDGIYELAEIQSQSSSAATSQSISGTGWNNAKNQTSTVNDYMKSTFDLAKQKLVGGKNESFVTDGTGTLWRRWDDNINDYSPNQMWGTSNGLFMSSSKWQNVDLAIGEGLYNGQLMYGIWGKMLCGEIIVGNNLQIKNTSGNYTITDDGFTAVNGIYSVGINPKTPSEIINVKVSGVKKFYIDTVTNELMFSGKINGGSISIGGGTFSVDSQGNCIANALTANNSVFTNGSFSGSIYASGGTLGNLTVNGTLTGGSINGSSIVGGTLNVGNGNCKIDSMGNFYAKTATFGGNMMSITLDNDEFKIIDKTDSTVKTRIWANSVDTGAIFCDSITLEGAMGIMGIIINGEGLSNFFSVKSHTHATLTDNSSGVAKVTVYGNNFRPHSETGDNSISCGSPSYRWTQLYAATSTVSTSDRNAKHDIADLDDVYRKLILRLKSVKFKYNDNSSNRWHTGFISNDVEILLDELGMSSLDLGAFIKSPTYKIVDEFGEFDTSSEITGYLYGLRYEEFISPAISVIQQQQLILIDLEHRIKELELKV